MGPEPPAIRVPVGEGSDRWTSRTVRRRVLLVVHNVTSAGRLLDLLPLFHDDFRVQLLVSSTGSSAFQDGTRALFHDLQIPELPWKQALSTPVDLAISASFGGELPMIQGKLTVLSHGVGYTKKLGKPGAGSREPGAGSREPGAGSREPGAGSREPGRRRSGCRPTGSCPAGSRSPTGSSSPTPSSVNASAGSARRRSPRPSSPETPASIACSPRARTGTGSGARWACAGGSGSSS
ncbi:hypothetical protein GCM10010305_46630 [Streptomyces termitum]|uniref:Uncharacterized protein n=1 Tax=Streptomyces termitum TaxID=67368 RepID=A0A918T5Z4_9ACTN|nr:hypothetical protein GCM10010305_46630 [Streptomyces termitum]